MYLAPNIEWGDTLARFGVGKIGQRRITAGTAKNRVCTNLEGGTWLPAKVNFRRAPPSSVFFFLSNFPLRLQRKCLARPFRRINQSGGFIWAIKLFHLVSSNLMIPFLHCQHVNTSTCQQPLSGGDGDKYFTVTGTGLAGTPLKHGRRATAYSLATRRTAFTTP